ncbi:hypothetical protein BC936DRAFT_149062, partial [Jimgerdemannia flammicorona]
LPRRLSSTLVGLNPNSKFSTSICDTDAIEPFSYLPTAIPQINPELGQSISAIYLSQSTDNAADHVPRSLRRKSQPSLRKQLAEAAEAALTDSDEDGGDKADDEADSDEIEFKEKTPAEKLQAIFGLSTVEELKGEWPCYLVRAVLLPGRLYLTERHICFYASLPRKEDVGGKSGFLLKKARTTKIYTRYYFELKNDVLSWCESSSDIYYSLGVIDLKYVLEVRQSKHGGEHAFKLVTVDRPYELRADTRQSMLEWINTLKKAIFRAKQNGDSVKIALRSDNILDIEKMAAFEFVDYVRIRTVDNDESYAMDEYYFAYFPDTNLTYHEIKAMWQANQPKTLASINTSVPTPQDRTDEALSLSPMSISAPSPTSPSTHIHQYPPLGASPSKGATTTSTVSAAVTTALSLFYLSRRSHEEPAPPAPTSTKNQKRSSFSSFLHNPTLSTLHRQHSPVPRPSASTEDDSYTSPEEAEGEKAMITWLNEKRRTGMRMVYDLLASSAPEHEQSGDEVDKEEIRQARLKDESFRRHFVLPENEKLIVVFQTHLLRTLPYYGKLYISTNYLCFRSKVVGTKLKVREYLHVREHKNLEALFRREEDIMHDMVQVPIPRDGPPLLTTSAPTNEKYVPPDKPLHVTCLTIGTRGDVQPYISLCKGLIKDGHKCRIATHAEYKDWIEGHGIEFSSIGGDPAELMVCTRACLIIRICVDNGFLSVGFVRDGFKLFKGWFDDLLATAWTACQGTDVLIESPSAMVGVHLAEKLGIAYFRAFPMPWTRTRSFPHPFATPDSPKGRLYNDMTYVMIDHVLWKATSFQVNRFRRQTLGLPATNWEKMEVHKVPFLYCFSASVVPPPLDWMDWIHTTGYWFLDNPDPGWQAPQSLLDFLGAKDERPIVYIGFGSIIVQDPDELSRIIVEAVLKANVRAIVSKGWSARLKERSPEDGKEFSEKEKLALQSSGDSLAEHPGVIYNVKSVPHDWLFPQVRGIVHHGGAGTTAAGLRAGVPTVVKPFFGDQYFWGDRLEDMGMGVCIKKFTVEKLVSALVKITTDGNMLERAREVGAKIRSEDGVANAIQCIYRDLELARNRLKKNVGDRVPHSLREVEGDHDSWTLIENRTWGTASASASAPASAPASAEAEASASASGSVSDPEFPSLVRQGGSETESWGMSSGSWTHETGKAPG